MSAHEIFLIGLAFCMVGVIFLTRSILSKRPRRAIEEFFGVQASTLSHLRYYVEAKYYAIAGAAFEILGFGCLGYVQLARFQVLQEDVSQQHLLIEGLVVLGLGGMTWLLAHVLSRNAFRRYLREFFQRNPWPFEKNLRLAKEIGQLFEIPDSPEDTVEKYLAKLYVALGVTGKISGSRVTPSSLLPSEEPFEE